MLVFSPDLGTVGGGSLVSASLHGGRVWMYMTSGMALCASIMPLYVLVESIV